MLRHLSIFKLRAKYLFRHIDDLRGVVVILGENERFRNIFPQLFAVGIEVFINAFFIRLQDLFDLIRIDDRAIQFVWVIIYPLNHFICGFRASPSSRFRHRSAGFDCTSMLCDFCLDPVNAGRHIDTVHDGIVIGVLFNDVVIEKSICFRRGSGGKAKHMSSGEIIQYGTPLAVN